jgi:hypothetical protein
MADEIMTPADYVATRLDDQIKWYDDKSLSHQKKFKKLRITEFIIAASIPVLTGVAVAIPALVPPTTPPGPPYLTTGMTIFIGLLGAAIAVVTGLLGLGRHQEQWLEYRGTCESLRKEKLLYSTRVEPYHEPNAFPLLVQRAETLISKENTNWAQYMMKPKEDKKEIKA